MNSYREVYFAVLAAIILSMLSGVAASAQGPADLSTATPATTADPAASADALPANPVPQTNASAAPGDGWRGAISIYGWFAGLHGTVGALGHDAGIHVPFSDLFHYLKGVIPIAVDAEKGRFVTSVDFLWMKLGDNRGIPFTDLTQTSVNIHITQSLLTPKIGYRLFDGEHLKIDALAGIRYWYLGQNLTLEPSGIGNSRSANWVDGLGGARFTVPLGERATILVSGDAGGGGASLDYQVLGTLNFKVTQRLGLGLGWRYLYVDYVGNRQFIYNTTTSGALAGFFYTFGGAPPVPPTATCTANPATVTVGEPVTVTATPANFNPKHTLTYLWTLSGGKLESANAATTKVDTTGMADGAHTANVTITDPRGPKLHNVANCGANFNVNVPKNPPQVTCSANPTTVKSGETSTITANAVSPDKAEITSYSYTSTAGTVSGTGTSATLDTTGLPGETVNVTVTATDSRGLSGTCTTQVGVIAEIKCVNIEDWGECTFEKNPKKPWRVDNDCKDTLDKLSLRLQQMPNGKLNIVGYTNEEEVVKEQTLGAQRAVNVKYYLTTDGPNQVDASRVQPRQGGTKGQATHFYFVPEGKLCAGQAEEGTVVDESQVQPQSRNAPAPKKHKKAPAAPQN